MLYLRGYDGMSDGSAPEHILRRSATGESLSGSSKLISPPNVPVGGTADTETAAASHYSTSSDSTPSSIPFLPHASSALLSTAIVQDDTTLNSQSAERSELDASGTRGNGDVQKSAVLFPSTVEMQLGESEFGPLQTSILTPSQLTKVAPTVMSSDVQEKEALPLPHLQVLAQIEKKEGVVSRNKAPRLAGYEETLEAYWGIKAVPLAAYSLGRARLVVCVEGVYQMDEAEDHVRFRGRDNQMEMGPWIVADCSDSD